MTRVRRSLLRAIQKPVAAAVLTGWDLRPCVLPGSSVSVGATKTCAKCQQVKPTGGGVDVQPGRWNCAACWKARNLAQRVRA